MLAKTFLLAIVPASLMAQSPASVLVVENANSAASKAIAGYYMAKRGIPARNLCVLRTVESEEIDRATFDNQIAAPVMAHLRRNQMIESVLYIVTTLGVPLKIRGSSGKDGDQAAVDSELTLLYQMLKGRRPPLNGGLPNPLFRQRDAVMRHPQMPLYLVTRLAGYDVADVQALIDRAGSARNRGIVVLDLRSNADEPGNDWLRNAAILLPEKRVLIDESAKVIYGAKGVIGYASWGSNDPNRTMRPLHFEWLPGAIATEYVSSNARTFVKPPDDWSFSSWSPADRPKWWMGSPQSLTADLIHEGATGASGHVYEPFLAQTPRPDYLFPAYFSGRNLAESYYIAIPALSWMNVVVGDPLCKLR